MSVYRPRFGGNGTMNFTNLDMSQTGVARPSGCLRACHPKHPLGRSFTNLLSIVLAAWAFHIPSLAQAQTNRELKVHLAQANNDSPYAFVRAKFNPGEVADPWAVRFFDEKGTEVPYFVWDFVTWRVAHEGRADWGYRYALINHAPGDAPEVLQARSQKLQWAKKNLPELGAKLEAREQAAKKAPDFVCAALYLL